MSLDLLAIVRRDEAREARRECLVWWWRLVRILAAGLAVLGFLRLWS